MSRRWEDLPSDLVDCITKRFDSSYATCIRFAAVCKSWRRHHITNHTRPRPQIPWLMLPYHDDDNKSTIRDFYCPVDRTTYHLDLSSEVDKGTLCRGSFCGWTANVEEDSGLHILNPLSNLLIRLPPKSTLPEVIDYDPNRLHEEYYLRCQRYKGLFYQDKRHIQVMYVEKVVCSTSTSTSGIDESCIFFMAIYGEFSRLAFCKLGDERWIPVSTEDEHCLFQDVVFHNGKFYAGRSNMVLECDLRSLQQPRRIPVESPFQSIPPDTKMYLASLDDEGLMMIVRFYHCKARTIDGYGKVYGYRTIKFEIFRLVLLEDGCGMVFKCSKVSSLGDKALFLGTNSPIFVNTSGIEGNHIYYTDDNWEHQRKGYFGGFDVGVFNMENGVTHELEGYRSDDILVWPPPTWVLPKPVGCA
ncbi:F-box protein SKIP23 [Linum grandiflorum]